MNLSSKVGIKRKLSEINSNDEHQGVLQTNPVAQIFNSNQILTKTYDDNIHQTIIEFLDHETRGNLLFASPRDINFVRKNIRGFSFRKQLSNQDDINLKGQWPKHLWINDNLSWSYDSTQIATFIRSIESSHVILNLEFDNNIKIQNVLDVSHNSANISPTFEDRAYKYLLSYRTSLFANPKVSSIDLKIEFELSPKMISAIGDFGDKVKRVEILLGDQTDLYSESEISHCVADMIKKCSNLVGVSVCNLLLDREFFSFMAGSPTQIESLHFTKSCIKVNKSFFASLRLCFPKLKILKFDTCSFFQDHDYVIGTCHNLSTLTKLSFESLRHFEVSRKVGNNELVDDNMAIDNNVCTSHQFCRLFFDYFSNKLPNLDYIYMVGADLLNLEPINFIPPQIKGLNLTSYKSSSNFFDRPDLISNLSQLRVLDLISDSQDLAEEDIKQLALLPSLVSLSILCETEYDLSDEAYDRLEKKFQDKMSYLIDELIIYGNFKKLTTLRIQYATEDDIELLINSDSIKLEVLEIKCVGIEQNKFLDINSYISELKKNFAMRLHKFQSIIIQGVSIKIK